MWLQSFTWRASGVPKHALILDLLGGSMGFCFGVLLISINEFPDSSVGKESACNAGDPV